MVSKKEKINKLILAFEEHLDFVDRWNESKEGYGRQKTYKMDRQKLRQFIISRLDVFDRNTVSNWINIAIAKGLIKNNPTSQMAAHKPKVIMPTNSTRYVIDDWFVRYRAKKIRENHFPHTQTKLDDVLNS